MVSEVSALRCGVCVSQATNNGDDKFSVSGAGAVTVMGTLAVSGAVTLSGSFTMSSGMTVTAGGLQVGCGFCARRCVFLSALSR